MTLSNSFPVLGVSLSEAFTDIFFLGQVNEKDRASPTLTPTLWVKKEQAVWDERKHPMQALLCLKN